MGKRTNHQGLYFRGRYWWLTKDPLTNRARSTRCTSLVAAREYQSERERLGANPAYAAAQGAELGEWCSRFVAAKERAGTRSVTLGYFRQKLGHWLRIHGQDAPLATFSDIETWDSYFAQRLDEGASRHTISKECKVFRQVLKSAKRSGCFPFEIEELRPEGLTTSYVPRDRALTVEELRALLPKLSRWLCALVALTVATGARLSEALKLEPGDVDLAGGLVVIRGTKTKGSNRVVPILSPFRPLLERAIASLPLGPLPNNLRRDLASACKRAGIVKVTPNDLRRSYATILAELGAGEEQTAKLLGHSSTEMVRKVYAKPRAQVLGATMERSIGDVDLGLDGPVSPEVTDAKLSKTLKSESTSENAPGFLSRRSHVQIVSGAPNPQSGARDCSADVVALRIRGNLPAPVWALALMAERFGLERRAA